MARIRVLTGGRVSIEATPGSPEVGFRVGIESGDLRVTERIQNTDGYSDAQLLRLRKELLAAQIGPAFAEVAPSRPTRGRPRTLTSHEARRAADAYRSAALDGRNVREAVAEEFGCWVNTADDYIKLARRLGFLDPA